MSLESGSFESPHDGADGPDASGRDDVPPVTGRRGVRRRRGSTRAAARPESSGTPESPGAEGFPAAPGVSSAPGFASGSESPGAEGEKPTAGSGTFGPSGRDTERAAPGTAADAAARDTPRRRGARRAGRHSAAGRTSDGRAASAATTSGSYDTTAGSAGDATVDPAVARTGRHAGPEPDREAGRHTPADRDGAAGGGMSADRGGHARAEPGREADSHTPADPGGHAGADRGDPGSHGRAGRDLRAATLVGVSLLVLIFASLFLWMPAFVGIVVIAVVLAVSELSQALNARGVAVPVVPVLIGAVLMCVGAYAGGVGPLVATFGLAIVAVGVWRLGDAAPGYLRDVTAGVFTTVYVPLLAGFVLLLAASDNGAWAVIALLAVVVASDTGGFAAGVLFGKHPMAPTVSPKKSWEGFAGSLVLGSAVGVAVVLLGFDGEWWMGLILGVVGVLSATVGDLGESLLKRDLGIKDMSDLLPGHGGIMDRVDSILPTAPVVWLVLTLTVGI